MMCRRPAWLAEGLFNARAVFWPGGGPCGPTRLCQSSRAGACILCFLSSAASNNTMSGLGSGSPITDAHGVESLGELGTWTRAHRVFVFFSEANSGVDCGATAPKDDCKECKVPAGGKTPSSCSYAAAMPDAAATNQPGALVSDSGEQLHPLTSMPLALYTDSSSNQQGDQHQPAAPATKRRSWWGWGGRSAAPASPDLPAACPAAADATVGAGTASTSSPSHPDSSLAAHRQRSSIPMAAPPPGAQLPKHQEGVEADGQQPVWTYPSEQMFYNAMQRKGWQPEARDMSTVVAIHNAVNERAWQEVCAWEALHCKDCPQGPRLAKFQGRPADLSPKARLLNLMGYALPFDRHDWVVDRCGKQVRYVIDFYAGVPRPGGPPAAMWLDTRPALDSVEAAWDRLRLAARWVVHNMVYSEPVPAALPTAPDTASSPAS